MLTASDIQARSWPGWYARYPVAEQADAELPV
jgi:hypothetical protein